MSTPKTPTTSPMIRTVSASALTSTSSTVSAPQSPPGRGSTGAMSSSREPPITKLQALWATPAAFAIVFVGAFGGAFSVGALAMWGGNDPQKLLAEGRIDDALLVIDSTSSPSAKWLLIKGKALQTRGQLEPMLLAYQGAVEGGAVDDDSLKHTLDALGDASVANLAVKTLEDWPGEEKLDATLLGLAGDPISLRRHKALEALKTRKDVEPATQLEAAIKVAVTDVGGDVCEDTHAGVKALTAWTTEPAAQPLLKKHRAFDAVLRIDNDAAAWKNACFPRDVVVRASKALADGAR